MTKDCKKKSIWARLIVIAVLAAENIFIEYMYAFAQGDTAHVVIRPSNVERCVEILNKFNCNVLTKNSL